MSTVLKDFPLHARERAAGVWGYRAHAEAIASGRFVQLARDLTDVGAPQVVVDLAHRGSEEEDKHISLCMDLVEALGARIERPPKPDFQLGDNLVDKEKTVLLQMVGTSCINETVSATVLAEMMRRAEEGLVHDTIQEILRDEIDHGRMGWAFLAHFAQKNNVGFVGAYLPKLLDIAVEDELFDTPDPDDPDAATMSLGTLPKTERSRLFVAAISELVLPGLEHFGVDIQPGRRWIQEKTS